MLGRGRLTCVPNLGRLLLQQVRLLGVPGPDEVADVLVPVALAVLQQLSSHSG